MKKLSNIIKSAGSPTCNPHIGIAILRIGIGLIFLFSGVSKLITLEVTTFMFAQIGLAAYWVYIVSILEAVGGLFLVLGFMTRYSSIVLGIIMLVATVIQFRFGGGVMGAMAPFVILLAMIQLYITGSHCWSLEARLSKGSKSASCSCEGGCDDCR